MQGVYSRQNTKSGPAAPTVSSEVMPSPTRTVSVETTLSLAIKPVINAVEIRQSPKPSDQARPLMNSWLSELVADCSNMEIKLITDMVLSLKSSLRRLRLDDPT